MVEYLGRGVHLAQNGEHLLIDERFELPEIHVEVLLEPTSNVLGSDLVEIHGHHDLLQRRPDHPLGLVPFSGSAVQQTTCNDAINRE